MQFSAVTVKLANSKCVNLSKLTLRVLALHCECLVGRSVKGVVLDPGEVGDI